MVIARGVAFGPYEILARIGEGGMGEVWRARDNRIGRDVAIKVLTGPFSAGDEAVRRFEQEARAAGGLNHPGLVTIFDVGTTDSSPYIVMELLEGQTLREALGELMPVALPFRKAIDYAIQLASALAVAHEKGIIHRDLKPENLFITTDGRMKILDFGLAKLVADTTDGDAHSRGTVRRLTKVGIAIGTPGYMSPEQARALPLDHRTDIFSLGAVLYEMISGRPAFDFLSATETMMAVVARQPPSLTTIDPEIPPELDEIVSHCLEKNPQERFQSTRDLAFQLRTLLSGQSTSGRPKAAAKAKRKIPYRAAMTLAALAVAALGGFALLRMRGSVPHPPVRTFRQLTFADGLESFPTLAPDGKSFAYVSSSSGNRDIYTQRVDGRVAANITSDSADDDSEPAFSPDGSQIAFRSERDGGGIFIMGVTGENARRLTDFGHNPSWSPDGTRLVVSSVGTDLKPQVHSFDGKLWIINARTGAKRLLDHARSAGDGAGGDSDALQPSWSPHGKRIAYWGVSAQGRRDIWTIDPDAAQPKQTVVRVTSDRALHWNPVWSPDGGYLYFGSDGDGTLNLERVAMDEESGKAIGAPEPLSLPGSISGNFAFSQKGELAFATVTRSHRVVALPFDAASARTGPPRQLFSGTLEIFSLAPSPDGQSIAFTTGGAQEDLFIVNADGTRMRQLTNDVARDRGVTWAPDGRMLYFYSNRDGDYCIWRIHTDGSGLERVTDEGDLHRIGADTISTPNVSPDGRTLVVLTDRSNAFVHLERPLARRMEAIPDKLGAARWSPDGEHIVGLLNPDPGLVVYSLRTRRSEVVLRRVIAWPQWLPDSRHVVFYERQNIGILDLDSRRETSAPFPLPGVQLGFTSMLSNDGSTLYVRQTVEQGDVWLVRFTNE